MGFNLKKKIIKKSYKILLSGFHIYKLKWMGDILSFMILEWQACFHKVVVSFTTSDNCLVSQLISYKWQWQ